MNIVVKEHFEKRWSLPELSQVRTFHGIYHGITEVAQSLAILFQHKRSFAWLEGWSPYSEPVVTHLMREGYQAIKLNASEWQSESFDPVAWVESLPKDTVFVLNTIDHPVTGAINPIFSQLDEALNAKRIYHIATSENYHSYRSLEASSFGCFVLHYSSQFAVLINGGRYRPPFLIAPYFEYSESHVLQKLQEVLSEDVNLVSEVHKQLADFVFANHQQTQGAQSAPSKISSQTEVALQDRVLFYFNDINAQAIYDLLCEKLPASLHSHIIPLSPCFAPSYKDMDKWWTDVPAAVLNSGSLLLIQLPALQHPQLVQSVRESVEKVLELQDIGR